MKHNIICVLSDCTIEDALRVVSQYEMGSWACVNLQKGEEVFVIKTSDTETAIHKNVKFGRKGTDNMRYLFEGRTYSWDDFWDKLMMIYNIDPDKLIIVEEDELY